ncbi:carbohydrate ABC transporter membrane protein 2 (CUT1 family) [Salana multivorans]|uniref:Carbohydrate ABC transporter membrane protein 2 (CUT1 family) n=1 Tax=Salana multivorans TaxID=120377 RepID=A0A3N2D9U0_9MICO|nr:carbohydrate ABC transporter permease [Salana multivorans]MBN8883813.1 carbohydrate ABC transporter permease [Salana multivorans]OJX95399.1 MAG: sugar ABC transporter permease [Micrococcales bacterium 73-15]ROR96575.1 carbohydrate ABC transporter membrane protein 2 (CUT1 family) [Salana multivorans]
MTAPAVQLASPRRRPSRVISNVILVLVGLAFVIPLAWIVLGSFNTEAKVSITWPSSWTLDNFITISTWDTTFRPLVNSAILSFGCAVITVVCSVLAAYPLSRYQMRFNRSLMYVILFGTCLPITAMMVPVYALFVSLNLLNTLWGTVLFLAATSLPMAIWMTKNFMDSIPVSLEEAAWVDGASAMTALRRIVVPLMRNGISVVFIFVFTMAWGNFFVPFVLLFSRENMPAAVAIFGFFGTYGTVAYGQLAAFSIMYAMPVLVLYLVTQKVSGGSFAMSGAVKG